MDGTNGARFYYLDDSNAWRPCNETQTFVAGKKYRYMVKAKKSGTNVTIPDTYTFFYVKEQSSSSQIKMTRLNQTDAYSYTASEKSSGVYAFYYEFTAIANDYWSVNNVSSIAIDSAHFGNDANTINYVKKISRW